MLRGRDFGDLNDVHMYFGWMGTETAKDLARLIQDYAAPLQREDYPFIVGECGLAREVNTPEYGLVADLADRDTAGVALHEVLWAGLFIGGAGTGMTWWWDEHVDLNDQYHQFRGISRFVRDVPWNREPFRHVVVAAGCNLNDLRAWELRGDRTRLVWIQSMHYNWWNVIHGARLSPIKNAWIVLEDARPGRYELEWWDTATGEITGRSEQMAEGGRIMIAVPDFTTDLALKVRLRD